ncbi:MAG: hypothetical protein ACTS2F_08640 [Thainema sp.]
MKPICESPLAVSLTQELPQRLRAHSYSIIDLAQEIAQDFECPLCEILTPMGEALMVLAEQHQIMFDRSRKQVMLTSA